MRKNLKCLAKVAVGIALLTSPFPVYASDAGHSSLINCNSKAGTYVFHHAATGGGGGYVPAIIFNQKEKNLIYARTDMGGAYRWDEKNSKWIGLSDWISSDNWNDLGCESLATDPVDPNRVYIAAGTYTNNWTNANGCILRSTNKGDTWERIELPFKLGGNMPGRCMGERLVIDPVANNVLYLGTRDGNGLWKSTDYGSTWSKVESFTAVGDYIDDNFKDQIGVVWEVFDPNSSEGLNKDGSKKTCKTIYVGVADKKQSVYVSHDAGKTWVPIEGQPTVENQKSWIKDNDHKNEPRAFLPMHGVLDSEGNLYITYSNDCGPYDGSKGDVWRYNTKSGQWTNISPIPSSDTENDYFGYGGIGLDAKKPGTLVVATLNSWWPDARFYRSTDYGKTWSPIWDWDGYPNKKYKYNLDISKAKWLTFNKIDDVEPSPKLGWMTGCVAIDPFNSDRMMYGTGATIYGTNNLTNWDTDKKIDISVMADGIEETAVQSVISTGFKDTSVICGAGDVAGFVYKQDLQKAPEKMFSPVFNTESMDFAEKSNNFLVRVGSSKDENDTKCVSFSYDGGENWFAGNNINRDPSMNGGTVAASVDASKVVWAPKNREAYYSTDNGNSWTRCEGIPSGAVVASDRVNKNKFYGIANGSFYVSTDGAKTFEKTVSGLPQYAKIKAVSGKEGHVWIADKDDGMLYSTDSGKSFEKVKGVQKAQTIGFGKAKEGADYDAIYTNAKVNGINGFYRSDDAGKTWIRINDDRNQFGSADADISGDPNIYGRVYIATNGLGLVYGDIKDKDEKLAGDVNGDKSIDITDFIKLKQFISHNGKGIVINEVNADINGDKKINISDLALLKKML